MPSVEWATVSGARTIWFSQSASKLSCLSLSFVLRSQALPGLRSRLTLIKGCAVSYVQKRVKIYFSMEIVAVEFLFLAFLDQLISRYRGRKIHMILDNAKYNKGPKVREWLKDKQHRIELHYLPPYSPILNAAEYVWKETRRKTTHNRFFRTLSEFKERLFRRFNRFQGNPASLRSVLASFA
jgi:transposase